ncbi:MAG: Bifunctional ligase/repressor BirA [Chloroflexi bacterium ADurb.Bin325]|nr:MAG: Bifunctional ligase/repressor BirA [Chloroflexi bacterium ADurb.Bin325]
MTDMNSFDAESFCAALATRRIGRPTRFYERVGSTNDLAHAAARAGAAEGLVIVADEQTAGRGRLDRRWWAPPGAALLLSLLLRPDLPAERAGQLSMCLGLAAAEAIEQTTGLHIGLKWPNDLVYAGRKLGGLLAEAEFAGAQVQYAILGLGLNVNLDFDAPAVLAAAGLDDLRGRAASLAMLLGRPVDRIGLLAALLAAFEARYDRLLAGESPHLAWAARLDTLGQRVRVALRGGAHIGVATGVTPGGGLILADDDGAEHVVWAGDVAALRPAGPDNDA